MINATQREQILRWIDSRDIAALARQDATLLEEFVTDLLESVEREYPIVNEDWLATQLRYLRFAGHFHLDRITLAWLEAHLSGARLDIASIALQNLWLAAPERRDIDPGLVNRLIVARQSVELTPEADASSLFALVRTMDAGLPIDTRRQVIEVLAEAATRTHPNPAVPPVLARALSTNSPSP